MTALPPTAGPDRHVPVLVVGGGPVGLSLTIGLARFGVRTLLVERSEGRSDFPRGRAVSTRTMEIYRQWGIADDIIAAGLPPAESLAFYAGATLVAERYTRTLTAPAARSSESSPTHTVICSQDRVESVLRGHTEKAAYAEVRPGTELVGLECGEHAVRVDLLDRRTGEVSTVRAGYLVAADGARSGVRERLRIPMEGADSVADNLNILFEADLRRHVADRLSAIYMITGGRRHATVLAVDNDRRWLLNLVATGVADTGPDGLSDDICRRIVREAVGLHDLAIRLVDRKTWQATAQVAAEFRSGRVLLAGDAAHVMTPYGGFGMNCGIADAHNLAWKLAAVTGGWAGTGLLDSYPWERRPVAVASAAESHRSLLAALAAHQDGTAPAPRSSDGLALGYHYHSEAVVDDGTPCPDSDPVADHVPTARPGHRAPHVWLDDGPRPTSTLDTLSSGFTLWAGPAVVAPAELAVAPHVPLRAYRMGTGPAGRRWMRACDVGPSGVVLVRPDGHVAYRCAASATGHAVKAALSHVLDGRSGPKT